MSKAKMKFPPVPGDTPRERFMNLARHIISIPKEAPVMTDEKVREVHRILKSRGFKFCDDETEAWLNLEERKRFSRKSIKDTSLEWLQTRLEEKVTEGEFWFYCYSALKATDLQHLALKYDLHGRGLIPVGIPFTSIH